MTQTVACGYCGSVVDARDSRHQALSRHQARIKHEPLVPLGSRGKLKGLELEAIGFLRRRVRYYGVDYEWSEHLLWSPFHGYRWLLEYDGHWTLLENCREKPEGA
ncbi:MAG: DUF4178 domain-containing protein [Elusimicrobia bacterium]|nr:DUF4178 domain-containing protein [Elusimicrobiota bacterium]